MAYDYIEQKSEYYDYYNDNPKPTLKQVLTWVIVTILLIILLVVGFDVYRYFRQVSFWNKIVNNYETTKELSGFEITNAAYKSLFSGADYIKLADGVYLSLSNNNFKNNSEHITDIIVSPRTVLSPELQLDETTGEYFHPYIDVREFFDEHYCCNHAAAGLPEFTLTDGTTGELTSHIQYFVFPVFSKDSKINFKRVEFSYYLYIFD